MRDSGCEQLQQITLEILRYFDHYAKEHGLTYYMAGGTLLGAVRHQGFIPWDDDIDLMMPRPDYERLFSIYDNQNKEYILMSCESDPDYKNPYARLSDPRNVLHYRDGTVKDTGVFIDIFPIDGYPANALSAKLHQYRLAVRRKKMDFKRARSSASRIKEVSKSIARLFLRRSVNEYCRQLNRLAKKYSYAESSYAGVAVTSLAHLFRERNEKKVYSETVFLPFEDLRLPAPAGYDTYLRKLYGDYMQLPPENQRVTQHDYILFTSRNDRF